MPEDVWFTPNAYAEWYLNTIRIPGSPAARHHQDVHQDAPYDDFLDAWTAADFDPAGWARLFAAAGAEYVVPTTKHHDGVALWDAPGTGARNTVHRGPRRDLVADIAAAVRAEGMRFGVCYSGGLGWSVTDLPPQTTFAEVQELRPRDAAYNLYAFEHVQDLVRRYEPSVLWNDTDSPTRASAVGRARCTRSSRATTPRCPTACSTTGGARPTTTSSRASTKPSRRGAAPWENNRGIGFSFGYNRAEDESQSLDGHQLAVYLTDVVSRGGRLLLDVGPTAEGVIPDVQRRARQGLGRWMDAAGPVLRTSSPVGAGLATPSDQPCVRWLRTPGHLVAVVDAAGTVPLSVTAGVDLADVRVLNGSAEVRRGGDGVTALGHAQRRWSLPHPAPAALTERESVCRLAPGVTRTPPACDLRRQRCALGYSTSDRMSRAVRTAPSSTAPSSTLANSCALRADSSTTFCSTVSADTRR